MTKAMDEFLLKCPSGKWFVTDDVITLSRPRYFLDRLVAAGKLESRVVGEYHSLTMEYRRLQDEQTMSALRQ